MSIYVVGALLGLIGFIGLPNHWLGLLGLFAAGLNLGILIGQSDD